jgi:tetratricopeptide (TPR) repeat protein
MRRLICVWGALILALVFATIAAAQTTTSGLEGEILDPNGQPWADVTVEIKNPSNGYLNTLKTDKNGKFLKMGLRAGIYTITVISEKDHINYASNMKISDEQPNSFKINFKDIVKSGGMTSPDEVKKREDEEAKFRDMKVHFEAGRDAMNKSEDLVKQIKAAPADQKGPLQDQLKTNVQAAITELQQAEQGMTAKDVSNHATVWGNLGQAYEYAGRYDDAAKAFQKAIELKPQAPYYEHLSLDLINAAVTQTDPKAADAMIADASASCDKAVAADPTVAAHCWRNIGAVLFNKSKMKEAVGPLQKATQADPKDAQAWFLLGSALSGTIDTKMEGEKMIYIIPPGTTEAFQKCIDAAPTGPYAVQAKQLLDGLAAMSGGEDTSVAKKKKK